MTTPLVRVRGQKAKSLASKLAQRLAEATAAAGTPDSARLHKPKPEQNAAPPEHVVAWIVRCAEAVKQDGYPEAASSILASVETYEDLSEC
jgi:hypothetical protein